MSDRIHVPLGSDEELRDLVYGWAEDEDRVTGADPHFVGGATEPAFENGWTADTPVTYYVEGSRVFLQGVVSGGTDATPIFTLPEGCRPLADCSFYTVVDLVAGQIAVTIDGAVTPSATERASLDGISFLASVATVPAPPAAPTLGTARIVGGFALTLPSGFQSTLADAIVTMETGFTGEGGLIVPQGIAIMLGLAVFDVDGNPIDPTWFSLGVAQIGDGYDRAVQDAQTNDFVALTSDQVVYVTTLSFANDDGTTTLVPVYATADGIALSQQTGELVTTNAPTVDANGDPLAPPNSPLYTVESQPDYLQAAIADPANALTITGPPFPDTAAELIAYVDGRWVLVASIDSNAATFDTTNGAIDYANNIVTWTKPDGADALAGVSGYVGSERIDSGGEPETTIVDYLWHTGATNADPGSGHASAATSGAQGFCISAEDAHGVDQTAVLLAKLAIGQAFQLYDDLGAAFTFFVDNAGASDFGTHFYVPTTTDPSTAGITWTENAPLHIAFVSVAPSGTTIVYVFVTNPGVEATADGAGAISVETIGATVGWGPRAFVDDGFAKPRTGTAPEYAPLTPGSDWTTNTPPPISVSVDTIETNPPTPDNSYVDPFLYSFDDLDVILPSALWWSVASIYAQLQNDWPALGGHIAYGVAIPYVPDPTGIVDLPIPDNDSTDAWVTDVPWLFDNSFAWGSDNESDWDYRVMANDWPTDTGIGPLDPTSWGFLGQLHIDEARINFYSTLPGLSVALDTDPDTGDVTDFSVPDPDVEANLDQEQVVFDPGDWTPRFFTPPDTGGFPAPYTYDPTQTIGDPGSGTFRMVGVAFCLSAHDADGNELHDTIIENQPTDSISSDALWTFADGLGHTAGSSGQANAGPGEATGYLTVDHGSWVELTLASAPDLTAFDTADGAVTIDAPEGS